MEAEFLQLAREAVAALQAANRTSWIDVAGVVIAGAQLLVSGVGLVTILVGLARMKEAGARRDREIDVLAESMRESTRFLSQSLERQGQALERQGQAMTRALERQGQALERQDEMMTEALQGLRQQNQVLAELLRRTA